MNLTVDKTHSNVAFSVRHMMFTTVRGQFADWATTLHTDDAGRIERVEVAVQTASIDTREQGRDQHLRSADFFDVDNHPQMTFVGVPEGDQSGRFQIVGELTIRGNSQPVTLDAEYLGSGKDPWGGTRHGYRATAAINRRDFGLNWNAALEAGGFLVGEKVSIEVELQAVAAAVQPADSAAAVAG